MSTKGSEKFTLSKEDIKKVMRTAMIIYSPVILLFLDQIQSWNFDIKILYALGVSVTIDVIRRFLKDYTK
jgi:hypothetical protein